MKKPIGTAFAALCIFALQAHGQHLLREHIGPLVGGGSPDVGFGSRVAWLGDLDLDGFDDYGIAAPLTNVSGTFSGSVNAYSGRSGTPLWISHGSVTLQALGAASMRSGGLINGDSVPDVLASGRFYRVLSGTDGSTLYEHSTLDSSLMLAPAGDIDGDSSGDYLVFSGTSNNGFGLVHVTSGATHTPIRTTLGGAGREIGNSSFSVGDVDSDGRDDYAIEISCGFPACSGGFDIYSGLSGNIIHSLRHNASYPRVRTRIQPAGDFDGDGFEDVYWHQERRNSSGFPILPILENDIVSGRTGLRLNVALPQYDGVFGDLDGDGRDDFFEETADSILIRSAATLQILAAVSSDLIPYTNSQENFQGLVFPSGAGDVDGDGVLDVLVGVDNLGPSSNPTQLEDRGVVRVHSIASPALSEPFCFGNGSVTPGCTPCPCSNDSPGAEPQGCLNSAGRSASLKVQGAVNLSNDLVQFKVAGAPSISFALLLSGPSQLPLSGPCPAGVGITGPLLDGIRCVGGTQIRHGSRAVDADGNVGNTTPGWGTPDGPVGGLLAQAGASAGQTRHFQAFYRDDLNAGCGTGVNTTNAISLNPRP